MEILSNSLLKKELFHMHIKKMDIYSIWLYYACHAASIQPFELHVTNTFLD